MFRDAIEALGKLATDALDLQLQANKSVYKRWSRSVELRPQTVESMEVARCLVQSFFSNASSEAYEQAMRADISLENVPNFEFEETRRKALTIMATELGILQE